MGLSLLAERAFFFYLLSFMFDNECTLTAVDQPNNKVLGAVLSFLNS